MNLRVQTNPDQTVALTELLHRYHEIQFGVGKRRLDAVFISKCVKRPNARREYRGDFHDVAQDPNAVRTTLPFPRASIFHYIRGSVKIPNMLNISSRAATATMAILGPTNSKRWLIAVRNSTVARNTVTRT